MKDPTANLIRAYEVRVGDEIKPPQWIWEYMRVDEIVPLGGDEMGPALWQFRMKDFWFGGSVMYPYAALVEVCNRGKDQ